MPHQPLAPACRSLLVNLHFNNVASFAKFDIVVELLIQDDPSLSKTSPLHISYIFLSYKYDQAKVVLRNVLTQLLALRKHPQRSTMRRVLHGSKYHTLFKSMQHKHAIEAVTI